MTVNPTRVADIIEAMGDAADDVPFTTMEEVILAAYRYAFLISSGYIEVSPDSDAARKYVVDRALALVQVLMSERPIDVPLVPRPGLKAPVEELRRTRARRRQEES